MMLGGMPVSGMHDSGGEDAFLARPRRSYVTVGH